MKQILQDIRKGRTFIENVPVPKAGKGEVLIRTGCTLVSAGTERMLVEFGKANLIDKARQQPDKVRMVMDKIGTDGLLPTFDAVRNKLDQPLALGYCNVGEVVSVGAGVTEFEPGDRVVSNGKHAEFVLVPKHLCARVPDAVPDEEAVFTVLGAIALQGIRLIKPTLGETVVVTGLGLIGLLAVQLLRANGCQVIAIDLAKDRLELAARLGAVALDASERDLPDQVHRITDGRGADAVLLAASTRSSDPVHQGAQMCRKRGRLVLVGVTGLELSRADFYEKELSLQVSCSYGPGRYDTDYEVKGHDYPLGHVRWTEQRNFVAVLSLMAEKRLSLVSLLSHRYPIEQAESAYALLAGDEPSLGILLQFPHHEVETERLLPLDSTPPAVSKQIPDPALPVLGFVGAGQYASRMLLPAFKKTGASIKTVACREGVSSVLAGRKNGVGFATTDIDHVLNDPDINTVVISTRHNSHASLAIAALEQGKHVFVEKPLTMNREELRLLNNAYLTSRDEKGAGPILMVGFNRRFSPHTQKLYQEISQPGGRPRTFVMTVNAGAVPGDHWTQDPVVGGGRIIGEACHHIDLLRYLAGTRVTDIGVACLPAEATNALPDSVTITLKFACGSLGTVHYFANGHSRFPKERLEVFDSGRVFQIDNFRTAEVFGKAGFRRFRTLRQDKGQIACAAAFVNAISEGKESPIPYTELLEVSSLTLTASEFSQGQKNTAVVAAAEPGTIGDVVCDS